MTKFVSNLYEERTRIYILFRAMHVLKLNVITENMYVGQIVLILTISIS